MSDDRRKKYLQVLLTAALTLLVYVLLFSIRGFWPLGKGSVLITDLYSQYTPLLYRFYDVVTGVKNPFMEFGLAAGTPLFADTANELINPFNYVLLLFGRERIYLAQNLLIALYGVAAAVSAQLCLRYFFGRPAGVSGARGVGGGAAAGVAGVSAGRAGNGGESAAGVAGAGASGAGDAGRQQESVRIGRMHVIEAALCVSYAVSGYAAYNYQIIKWMIFPVLFPLFVMALHRLLTGGKAFWYTLLLAYQLMLSVQLGIMTLLFTLFATVFYLHWRHGGVMLSRLGLATLCGILLAAPVFLPAVYTLFTSARAGEIASYTNIMRRHGLDDIADRLFQIAHPALIAMLVVALIAWRRQRGKAALRVADKDPVANQNDTATQPSPQKCTSVIKYLMAWNIFLWFTALFEPANLLWHLGSYICFPVRYAYMSLFSVAVTVRYLAGQADTAAAPRDAMDSDEHSVRHEDENLEAAAPGGRMDSAERLALHEDENLDAAAPRDVMDSGERLFRHGAETTGSAECPAKPERDGIMQHAGRRLTAERSGTIDRQGRRLTAERDGIMQHAGRRPTAERSGTIDRQGRRPTIVILAVTSCACLAAALLVTLRHELPITQVFSSLVITAYPRVLLYVLLAMALLFAAGLCAALPASSRRGGVLTAMMLPVTCVATSLTLQLFVYLPESYGIRHANQTAYERLSEAVPETPDDNPFALAAYDETLPRNAALVNRAHTITSYLPAVPKKTQEVLSSLGFDTYWMATYDTGGTEEARALLAHAYLVDGGILYGETDPSGDGQAEMDVFDASQGIPADVSVNEGSGLVTAQLTDVKEGDVLYLPLIAHEGWRVTIRSTTSQTRTENISALSPDGLMTIPLHAGDSEIILRFTPPYLRLGCILFAAGLLLLFLMRVMRDRSVGAAAPRDVMDSGERLVRHGAETTGSAECLAKSERDGIMQHAGRRLTAPGRRHKSEHLCRMLYMLLLGAATLGIYLIPLVGQAYYTVKEAITGKEEQAVFDTPAHALLKATVTEEGILAEMAGENLVRARAVTVSADSVETESFPAMLVRDGDDESQTSRWSSANDHEHCDHWLRLDFPEEEEIALLRVTWERDNMTRYAVETSEDGDNWTEVLAFDTAPEELVQDIRFPEAVRTKHLRLHFTDVRREEEDGTLYYQNVSVLELEAYDAASQEQFLIETPVIPAGTGRRLPTPAVPEGYALQFAGADYEMLIDAEGNIRDTLSDVPVEIGYTLTFDGGQEALPGMHVTIPASEADAAGVTLPAGIEVMECMSVAGSSVDQAAAQSVRLLLTEEDDPRVAGAEGFQLEIGGPEHPEVIVIYAQTVAGLRWGEVTLLELMEETEGVLPACVIRDYPRYAVRGFGVDVARRMVPMEWLYRVVEELSRNKMNTLQLHLNDNHIVAEHSYDGTLQGAYDLYAGFRLESSIENEQGEGITSTDLYYTDAEFKALVQYAASLGVTIVPEIDTPAHSLAFIRVFPELGVKRITDMADTLDLSSEDAKTFAKNLWSEYLSGEDALFADCPVLHLGMDEYFGEGEVYLSYLKDMTAYVASLAPEKELRVWGSLDWYEDLPYDLPADLTMQVWSPEWCDVRRAFARGHGIINSLSHQLYIIPGTGQELQELAAGEEVWSPNTFEDGRNTFTIPAYSPQMKGACYMLWNDHSGEGGALREEYDDESLFELFRAPLPAIAGELW
ncbi:MAG: YfhO family protein [Lachnospiraceae bacterium]|nr:YfhO family protein [Lachnospiraceae bacterium]